MEEEEEVHELFGEENEDDEEEEVENFDDSTVLISQSAKKIQKLEKNDEKQSDQQQQQQSSQKNCVCCEHKNSVTCSICFELFTVAGDHRLSSLKCGHLFGYECIANWIKTCGANAKCPLCNTKTKLNQIRMIYANLILAEDNTQSHTLRINLEREKEEKCRLESQVMQLNFKMQLKEKELEAIKAEKKEILDQIEHKALNRDPSTSDQITKNSFEFFKTIKVSEKGGCRFIELCPNYNSLITITPSISQLAPGYGIRVVSLLEHKPIQYIPTHQKVVKSVATVGETLILTASLDKTIKLTDLRSSTAVFKIDSDHVPWSACSNTDDENFFYCGFNNGSVGTYDIRQLMIPVHQTNAKECGAKVQPCTNLQYVPKLPYKPNGVICGQLGYLSFYFCEQNKAIDKFKPMGMSGIISNLDFEPESQHLLVTKKPDTLKPYLRHEVILLEIFENVQNTKQVEESVLKTHLMHSFKGGGLNTYMNRSHIYRNPSCNDELCVFSGDESSRSICSWNITNGKMQNKIYTKFNILDTCFVKRDLYALSDESLTVFKC